MNLENPKLIKELEIIIKAAGKEILEVYGQDDFTVQTKTDESPLTIADQNAHNVIVKGLSELDGAISIISEEHKNRTYEARKDDEWQWLVDPLDGTKEFIKRNGEFTVNIALLHYQKPVLGMVYVPVVDALYYGIENRGSFKKTHDKESLLKAPKFQWTDPGLRVLVSRSHLNEATQEFLNDLDQPIQISAGSSLKFLKIAEGEAEVYPRLAPTMEWDTAAAHVVLQEAGGHVLEYLERAPLHYNKEVLKNPFFLAFGDAEISS